MLLTGKRPPAVRDILTWVFLAGISLAFLTGLAVEAHYEGKALAAAGGFAVALWAGCLWLRCLGDYDRWLLPLAGALNIIGLLIAYRLDPKLFYLQTAYSVGALLLLLLIVQVTRVYPSWLMACRRLALAAMGVLALTALAGRQVDGAKSWLFIGPLSFEPSQPALAFFGVAAGTVLGDSLQELWFVPVAMGLLAATHNLGAVLVFILVLGVVAFLAGWSGRRLALAAGCFLALALFFYLTFPVVPARLTLWLAPARSSAPGSWQMARAFEAFASGGLTGAGFAGTAPQAIPVAGSDFVFAVWAGFTGVWGTWLLLAFFVGFLYRSLKASSPVGAALGLLLTCQAFLLAGGNTGLLPLTGVAMPFVSRGGSTIFGSYLATAMLLGLGPPLRPGRRERVVLWAAGVAAFAIALSALAHSLAG